MLNLPRIEKQSAGGVVSAKQEATRAQATGKIDERIGQRETTALKSARRCVDRLAMRSFYLLS